MWNIKLHIWIYITKFQETYNNVIKCDYTFDEPELQDISEDAKDFIFKLLQLSQDHRMSADDALNHQWLNSSSSTFNRTSMAPASAKLTDVMSRLRWQKCTNVIVACSKFKHLADQSHEWWTFLKQKCIHQIVIL